MRRPLQLDASRLQLSFPDNPYPLNYLEVAKRSNYSEHRALKVRFSLATIAFETENQLKCLKYYRRKGKTHLQTPILTI